MRRFLSVLIAFFLAVPPSFAQSFKILGTRPLGMGGAGVAVAQGGTSQYWNPAGLALQKGFEVETPFGIGAEFTKDLLKEANDLARLATKIDAIQAKTDASALSLTEYQDFLNALVQINDLNKEGLGVLGEFQGGADMRIGRFAVSYNNFTEFGADPFVDTVNMGLSGGIFGAGVDASVLDLNGDFINGNNPGVNATDQATLAGIITSMQGNLGIQLPVGATGAEVANELIYQAMQSQTPAEVSQAINQIQQLYNQALAFLPGGINPFGANQTNLTLRGASVWELSVGAGGWLPFQDNAFLKHFSVGANAKLMRGDVGYAKINVLDKDVSTSDLRTDFTNNMKTSTAFGVDVGVLYDLQDSRVHSRFGVVARNINRPKFAQPQAGKSAGLKDYPLDPQLRAGWAWRPLNWMVVAADVDLTNNTTSLPGYKSRQAGGGLEINIFNRSWLNLALRGGLLKNVSEKESPLAYTGGFGLNILHVCLDVGGAVSSKSVKIDTGDEIPSSVRVAANLGVRF